MNLAPMDGHCVLLMETQPDQKTFSDHPNVVTCLDSLLAIYEDLPGREEQYTLDTIWKWLDQFTSITLLVFNEELARYKKLKHSELKELFIPAIQRQHEPKSKQPNGITTNGNKNRNQQNNSNQTINGTRANESHSNSSFRERFNDDDDDDEEEDWD